MKKIFSYVLLCTGLIIGSCVEDKGIAQSEGSVSFEIRMTSSETRAYDPMETLIVRIYKENGGLIRRYTSLEEMPENLYLVAGNYTIAVDAGDNSPATWSNKTYHGEKAFTVKANQTITEQVVCKSLNVGAMVNFDSTIMAKMDKGAYVYISTSDSFALSAIDEVPTLKYDLSETAQTGYFLLPEGVTNLSWGFYAESTELGSVTQTGVIEQVEALSIYKLKFQYSKTPDGFGDISVQVDKKIEDHFDDLIFSPQPSIKGDGFLSSELVAFYNNTLRFNVTSVKKLTQITLQINESIYSIFDTESQQTPPTGISYEVVDDKNGTVIITPEFLSSLQGGIHIMDFKIKDVDQGNGEGSFSVATPGPLPVTAANYSPWNDTATLQAIVTDPAAMNVKIAYRIENGEWNELQAEKSDKFTYTVRTIPTTWSVTKNAKEKEIYNITSSGLIPGCTYELCSSANGAESKTLTFTTPQGNTIPTLNDDKLSCYGQSNESVAFWGSGNNSMAKTLCNYSSEVGGANLAALSNAGTELVSMFAPGNLFTGTFKYASMNGTVSFGNKYTFTARPKALKLKYKGSIGNVTHNKHSGPLANNTPDKARIFVAIVDWSTQHKVASGTSAPSGMWSPEDGINAVAEGKVIGYSILDLEGVVNDLTEFTLPINYYDKELKPAAENYSLVISCATSAYGDYINGCKTNSMYISNFTWEY